MGNSKKIILIVLAVVVVVLITGYFLFFHGASSPTGNGGNGSAATGTQSGNGVPGATATRAPAPTDVTVPAPGQSTSSDVAVPQTVTPVNPHNATAEDRTFTISADNNQFTPDTIIVNQGDEINLLITAVDKAYDFTQPDYGFREKIPVGTTKTVQFGATATGKFTFYCASCGGPSAGPVGYIEVVAH